MGASFRGASNLRPQPIGEMKIKIANFCFGLWTQSVKVVLDEHFSPNRRLAELIVRFIAETVGTANGQERK